MEYEEKSKLESFFGNLVTLTTATAIGAFAGGIPGAILPILTNSIAHKRQIERVDKALNEILNILDSYRHKLEQITDAQYKIISESISCVHKCVDDKKIEYLKNTIKNALTSDKIKHEETEKISRIIRDISVTEANFIVEKSLNGKSFDRIKILDNPSPPRSEFNSELNQARITIQFVNKDDFVQDNCLNIRDDSDTNQIVYDLQILGLLRNSGKDNKGTIYKFTPISEKITQLIKCQLKYPFNT